MKPAALTILRTSPRVRFKNILFATDLSAASAQAQLYAVLLAHMFGSHLFVLHVEAGPGLSPRYKGASPSLAHKTAKAVAPEIGELEAFFRASGVPCTLMLEHGELRDVLQRVAGEHSIDVIILGSHGRHGISYLFQGSVADDITRSLTYPVITVGPKAQSGFDNALHTILFATDLSEESKMALPYATSLAQEFHADLTVLHVAPERERLIRDREHVEAYLMNQLKNLAPQSRFPWCAVSHVVTFGDAATEILDATKDRDADLIVLGLHNSVQFTSHLPERLCYRVLCEAPCPVMTILPGTGELKLARLPSEFLATAPHMN